MRVTISIGDRIYEQGTHRSALIYEVISPTHSVPVFDPTVEQRRLLRIEVLNLETNPKR